MVYVLKFKIIFILGTLLLLTPFVARSLFWSRGLAWFQTKFVELTDSFGGDVSGTYDNLRVVNTSGLIMSNITDPTDCLANQYAYGKTGSAWDCRADLFNTTEEVEDEVGTMLMGNTETLITVTYQDGDGTIDFVVDNDLHSYDWSSVVDADITDTLTCSIMNLGTSTFTGTLHGDNITADSLDGDQIAELTDADISNTLTCSDLVAGSAVVADSEVVDALTITNGNFTGAGWVNSTVGMKLSDNVKFYFGTDDDYCIFYNSTSAALEGSTC